MNFRLSVKLSRKIYLIRRKFTRSIAMEATNTKDAPGAEIDNQPCQCAVRNKFKNNNQKCRFEIQRLRTEQENALHNIVKSIQLSNAEEPGHDMIMFDSHCHLQLDPLCENANEAVALALQLGLKHMVVCGTEPGADWQKVLALSEAHPEVVIPSFGLHPWWVKGYYSPRECILEGEERSCWDHSAWLPELESLLQQHPSAGVGEAGLDRGVVKEVPYALQEEVLRQHMHLAGKYKRALTLHCVGCWDRLFNMLHQQYKRYIQKQKDTRIAERKVSTVDKSSLNYESAHSIEGDYCFPASIVLHSCASMPIHLVQSFAKLPNTYFSLSMGGRGNSNELSEKMTAFVRAIPIDRLLLETDSPDQLPLPFKLTHHSRAVKAPDAPITDNVRNESGEETESHYYLQYNEPAMLRYHCVQIARALDIVPNILAQQTTANSIKAFGIVL